MCAGRDERPSHAAVPRWHDTATVAPTGHSSVRRSSAPFGNLCPLPPNHPDAESIANTGALMANEFRTRPATT
jgi:hypothetical protein